MKPSLEAYQQTTRAYNQYHIQLQALPVAKLSPQSLVTYKTGLSWLDPNNILAHHSTLSRRNCSPSLSIITSPLPTSSGCPRLVTSFIDSAVGDIHLTDKGSSHSSRRGNSVTTATSDLSLAWCINLAEATDLSWVGCSVRDVVSGQDV